MKLGKFTNLLIYINPYRQFILILTAIKQMNISIYLITCLHEFAITMKINVAYNDDQFFGGVHAIFSKSLQIKLLLF